MTHDDHRDRLPHEPRRREPLFNAPLTVFILPLGLVAFYIVQISSGERAEIDLLNSFALNPLLLRQGQVELLLTHQFLHGSWLHVLMNAAFCTAFTAPVLRACSGGLVGFMSYMGFFLTCGIVAGLGFCVVNWFSNDPVIGASGAISGLLAASMRLWNVKAPATLVPLLSRQVVVMTLIWCLFYPMASVFLGEVSGGPVAWEAHIAGYICGLFLIGPWLRIFSPAFFAHANSSR